MTALAAEMLLLLPGLFGPSRGAPPEASPPGPVILVENRTALVREETLLVSVPFPEGRVRGIPPLTAGKRPTAWRILERWPDGSLRIAQAQVPLRLAPRERLNIPLREGKPLEGPFRPHPWFQDRPPGPLLEIEAAFPDSKPARISVDAAGEILEETPLVRISRRLLKLGGGRVLRVYLAEFSATPVLRLDLVLPPPKDPRKAPPFRHLDLVERDLPLMFLLPRLSGVEAPLRDRDGRLHYPLPVKHPLQGKQVFHWRVFLLLDSSRAPTLRRGIARRTWQAMALRPLDALCDAPTWLRSGALTLFGGPAPPPPDWRRRILRETAFQAGRNPLYLARIPDFPVKGSEAVRIGPCDPFWLHAVQTSRGGLLESLSPGFDAWTGLGVWWSRDLFLEGVEAAKEKFRSAASIAGPAAEGLLARILAEASLVRPEGRKADRAFLEERLRRLVLPWLKKDPSRVLPSQAGSFLLGMWAAARHLGIEEAREACRLVLRALPAKDSLPLETALPLHLLSRDTRLPEPLRKKARTLARTVLDSLQEGPRLWDTRTALIPLSR